MIADLLASVHEFHKKMGHETMYERLPAERITNATDQCIACLHEHMMVTAQVLEESVKETKSTKALRLALIIEECAELIRAIDVGHEVEVLDGMADLMYVVAGTALTYRLPLKEALEEVCRSNLTKQRKDLRCRDKGSAYVPPDLAGVYNEHYPFEVPDAADSKQC